MTLCNVQQHPPILSEVKGQRIHEEKGKCVELLWKYFAAFSFMWLCLKFNCTNINPFIYLEPVVTIIHLKKIPLRVYGVSVWNIYSLGWCPNVMGWVPVKLFHSISLLAEINISACYSVFKYWYQFNWS